MLIGSGSIEVEQEYIVVTDWYSRIEGNVGHIHIVWLWRRKVKKAKRSIFLFYLFFFEFYQFVILI